LGDYRTCVVADIPGLIEGAHEGAGLGDRFLRHIERTKLLVHVVDLSSLAKDPIEAYRTIRHELAAYSSIVADKPEIVVANKIDAMDELERLTEFKSFCVKNGLEFYAISAATQTGIKELIYALRRKLDEMQSASFESRPS
jgi:GTPase